MVQTAVYTSLVNRRRSRNADASFSKISPSTSGPYCWKSMMYDTDDPQERCKIEDTLTLYAHGLSTNDYNAV